MSNWKTYKTDPPGSDKYYSVGVINVDACVLMEGDLESTTVITVSGFKLELGCGITELIDLPEGDELLMRRDGVRLRVVNTEPESPPDVVTFIADDRVDEVKTREEEYKPFDGMDLDGLLDMSDLKDLPT